MPSTCMGTGVAAARVQVHMLADLQAPAANGLVIGGACNYAVLHVDGQIGDLSIMTTARPQQQCCLAAPNLQVKTSVSSELL